MKKFPTWYADVPTYIGLVLVALLVLISSTAWSANLSCVDDSMTHAERDSLIKLRCVAETTSDIRAQVCYHDQLDSALRMAKGMLLVPTMKNQHVKETFAIVFLGCCEGTFDHNYGIPDYSAMAVCVEAALDELGR